MKALILLGTLKKEGMSNTEVLSEFLAGYFKKQDIDCSIVKLVEHNILAGTYSDMGEGDDWPGILQQILAADIIVFATPIWWNNQSSEIQRVIERLDELHDEILEGKKSRLEGKVGGIVITGDSDGAQHIIANISNFYNAVGMVLPPYASLSVLWEKQAKGEKTSREELMKKYEEDYASTAESMVKQMLRYLPKSSS
ncbi:flavodoxin family protein [Pontibacter lucknowensis]|uniref:Multimeric flavodoxin WrbA n=1 Tax=Pontibacter lucknowensis TaxID=1077936 RepID=A0A1N7A1H7_9BACT|nr:NAD(P)H-dependent oxidoreductase [Pontibacter lucknowensis]SIR32934.1 Multimeric flavodoxin WrbA [Pontibacter lucknowensis]